MWKRQPPQCWNNMNVAIKNYYRRRIELNFGLYSRFGVPLANTRVVQDKLPKVVGWQGLRHVHVFVRQWQVFFMLPWIVARPMDWYIIRHMTIRKAVSLWFITLLVKYSFSLLSINFLNISSVSSEHICWACSWIVCQLGWIWRSTERFFGRSFIAHTNELQNIVFFNEVLRFDQTRVRFSISETSYP